MQTLTESMFYILLLLHKEKHGYQIMKEIDMMTEGRVKIGPGTMYSLLSRFEKENLIIKVSSEDGKKVYLVTELGKEIINVDFRRLKSMVKDAEGIL